MSGLKVAVVHDWFQGFHGSERVVEAMVSDVFADAERCDVYAFSAARELLPDRLARRIVRTARVSELPGIRQVGHDPGRWRMLLPYMPRWFSRLDLAGYDLVVSSSHSCAVHAHPPPPAAHLCYCYSPMRYVWLPDVEEGRTGGVATTALRGFAPWLRRRDHAAAQQVGRYVTLSQVVAERIERFYGRESAIVFPPVEADSFSAAVTSGTREPGHVLWVHRMVSYKRPLQVMDSFSGLDQKLTMVGVGPLHDEVAARAPANVTVHGWLERDELIDLYARASAFVHIGEEDFGITMVEALAAGVPVIALDRGGARDIVRDGIDGVLIADTATATLRRAIAEVTGREWDAAALAARAAEFSRERFVERFTAQVQAVLR